jgi:outer membrane protein TolC
MKKLFFSVLIFLTLSAFTVAGDNAQAIRFTVNQAIEVALALNPRVLEAREQITEFNQLVRQARSEALPKVEALVSVVANRDPGLLNSPFFSQLLEGPDPLPPEATQPLRFENFIWNFSVRQPIYSFGRVKNAIRAADNELTGIQGDVREEENRVSRDVARACYGFLLSQQRLEVLKTEREARERQLQQVEDRFELEDATRLDVLRARVALANLGPEILAADNELRIAQALVNDTLGRPIAAPIEVDAVLEVPDPLPNVPGPDELMILAAQTRPELLRFGVDRRVLENRVGVVRADVLPQFDANAQIGINTFGLAQFANTGFRSWAVGVSMNWTIFDGLATPAAMNVLRSQVDQKRYEEASFRSTLALELQRTTGTWKRALEAVEVAAVAVEQAREAERVSEEFLRWGAATTLDVLESTRSLRDAELNQAQAAHEALVALAEMKYLIGHRADARDSVLEGSRAAASAIGENP